VKYLSIGGKVPLVNASSGTLEMFSEDEAKKLMHTDAYYPATEQFYKLEQESKQYDSPFAAAGLGLARAMTLGLSDYAIPAIASTLGADSEATREYINKVSQYNPTASIIGEIGGFVAPTGIPGIVGKAVMKGAAKVGGQMAGAGLRGSHLVGGAGGQLLARGLTEGVEAGVMEAVSRRALRAPGEKGPEFVDDLLNSVKRGVGFGAAFTFLGLGLGSSGRWLWGKVSKRAKHVQQLSDEARQLENALQKEVNAHHIGQTASKAHAEQRMQTPGIEPMGPLPDDVLTSAPPLDDVFAPPGGRAITSPDAETLVTSSPLFDADTMISKAPSIDDVLTSAPRLDDVIPGSAPIGPSAGTAQFRKPRADPFDDRAALFTDPSMEFAPPAVSRDAATLIEPLPPTRVDLHPPTAVAPHPTFADPQLGAALADTGLVPTPTARPALAMEPTISAAPRLPKNKHVTPEQMNALRWMAGDPRLGEELVAPLKQLLAGTTPEQISRKQFGFFKGKLGKELHKRIDELLPVVPKKDVPVGVRKALWPNLRAGATDPRLPEELRRRIITAMDDLPKLTKKEAQKLVDEIKQHRALEAADTALSAPPEALRGDIPTQAVRRGKTADVRPAPLEPGPTGPVSSPVLPTETGPLERGMFPGLTGPVKSPFAPSHLTGPVPAGPFDLGMTGPVKSPFLPSNLTGPVSVDPLVPGMTRPVSPWTRPATQVGPIMDPHPPRVRELQNALARKMEQVNEARRVTVSPFVKQLAPMLGAAGAGLILGGGPLGAIGGGILGYLARRAIFWQVSRMLQPMAQRLAAGVVGKLPTGRIIETVEKVGKRTADVGNVARIATTKILSEKDYDEITDELNRTDPKVLTTSILAALDGAPPQLARSAVQHNLDVLALLQDVFGTPRGTTGDLFGQDDAPSTMQKIRASRILRTAMAPETALLSFAKLELVDDQVEALERIPLYRQALDKHREFVRAVVQEYVARGGRYSRKQREQIQIWLGEKKATQLRDPELMMMLSSPQRQAPPGPGGPSVQAPPLSSKTEQIQQSTS
jgi:hypothetical protein